MAQFGNNPGRDNWFFSDGASDNQAWDNAIAVSDVGRITDINAYFSGDTASCTGGPVIWGAGGAVAQYTGRGIARGTRGVNGGVTNTTSIDITFTNPTTYFLGGFRNSADSWIVPFADNAGAYGVMKTSAGTSPGTSSGGSTWLSQTGFNGGISAWANYFSVQLYVRRGSGWTKIQWQVRRSGSWVIPKVYVRRGGGWTQVGIVAREQELDWITEIKCVIEWAKGMWEYGLLRWDYDQGPKTFGRTRSGIVLAGEYA